MFCVRETQMRFVLLWWNMYTSTCNFAFFVVLSTSSFQQQPRAIPTCYFCLQHVIVSLADAIMAFVLLFSVRLSMGGRSAQFHSRWSYFALMHPICHNHRVMNLLIFTPRCCRCVLHCYLFICEHIFPRAIVRVRGTGLLLSNLSFHDARLNVHRTHTWWHVFDNVVRSWWHWCVTLWCVLYDQRYVMTGSYLYWLTNQLMQLPQ